MDAIAITKWRHPQKRYIKFICKVLYFLGMGECWYEKKNPPKYPILYKVWGIICNVYIIAILANELLAYMRSDLNEKDRNDLVIFTTAHPTIFSKILSLYYFRKRIVEVLQRLLEGTRSIYHSPDLDKKCVKESIKYTWVICVGSYITLFSATVDGIRTHLNDDTPIHVEITYYPKASTHRGFLVRIFQFFIEFHWWYIVAIMASIDSLTISSLVSVGYKFKLLQKYFKELRKKLVENREQKSLLDLEEEFKKNFVVGIQLHEDALWCARNVQSALGTFYSIQVFECVSLIVMCLVKLVAAERNMTYLLATFTFIFCLILLTGAYMMAAGDITHEAALVSTSIFHCGWELTSVRSDLRVLAVVALQRSQVPVYMTAFGILTLSYSNFISVLRSSYSFFAVMY